MTDAEKIAELERRVAHLEQVGRRYGPIEAKPATEPLPSHPVWPIIPAMGANPRRPKCNVELSPVMGYVCSNFGSCPTGLGGFSCAVATDCISRNDVTVTVTNTTGKPIGPVEPLSFPGSFWNGVKLMAT